MEKEREIILLDISKSMEIQDIPPSRLEYAKSLIREKVDSDHSIGLVVFAGKSFTISPPSTDQRGLMKIIDSLHTDMIRQDLPDTSGTNIGDAIIHGLDLLSGAGSSGSLTIITDGQANTGLDPLIALEEARKQQKKIHVITLGSFSGSTTSSAQENEYHFNAIREGTGRIVGPTGGMETTLLESIAHLSSGSYQRVTQTSSGEKRSDIHAIEEKGVFPKTGLISSIIILSVLHLMLTGAFIVQEKRRKKLAI